jgi:hypothetical protein
MNHSPMCCVYSIPSDESNERLRTVSIQADAQSVHRHAKNELNSKKDVII